MRYREHGQNVSLHPTDRCLMLVGHEHTLPHVEYAGLSEWPHLQRQAREGNVVTAVTEAQIMAARQRSGGQLTLWMGQLKVEGGRDPDRDRELRKLSSWTWRNAPVTRLRDLDATVRICRVHRVSVPQTLPDPETVQRVGKWCDTLDQRLRDRQHWLPAVTSGLFQQMLLNLWTTGAGPSHLARAADVLIDALSGHDYSRVFAGLDENATDTLSNRLLDDLGLTWHFQTPVVTGSAERVS